MRATYPILKVLGAFGDGKAMLCGAEIARATKIGPGTLYPLLARLERGGMFKASWEKVDPSEVGRPRRRFYKMTAAGVSWRNQIATDLGERRMETLRETQQRRLNDERISAAFEAWWVERTGEPMKILPNHAHAAFFAGYALAKSEIADSTKSQPI